MMKIYVRKMNEWFDYYNSTEEVKDESPYKIGIIGSQTYENKKKILPFSVIDGAAKNAASKIYGPDPEMGDGPEVA